MRFLIDECLPPRMAVLLRDAGHDCAHVYELGLGGQPDEQVMAWRTARTGSCYPPIPTSGNFSPTHLCSRRASSCSGAPDKRGRFPAAVVLANLEQVAGDLAAGALVVISDTRIRARRLPMKQSD